MDAQNPDISPCNQLLEVVQTSVFPLQGRQGGSYSLISYRRADTGSTIHVSDLYLQQRLIQLAKEDGEGEGTDAWAGLSGEAGYEEEMPSVRYFHPLVERERNCARCFHCGMEGHSAKYCRIGSEQTICLFCLGGHSYNACNARTCFHCNQMGHVARQCRALRTRCRKCGNKGHSTEQCGTIVFLNSNGIRFDKQFRDQYGFDDLARVRCMAGCRFPMGHFNCHQYADTRDHFYAQSSLQRSLLRQKYILSTYSHLREHYFRTQIARAKMAPNNKQEQNAQEKEQGRDEGTAMVTR